MMNKSPNDLMFIITQKTMSTNEQSKDDEQMINVTVCVLRLYLMLQTDKGKSYE